MAGSEKAGVRGVFDDIGRILEQVEALRELAADDDALEGAQVYDFNVRWGALLAGRLERLRHYFRRGELTGEQREHYLNMEDQLRQVVPLAERIDVSRPTAPPESAEAR